MAIQQKFYGKLPDGREAKLFTLTNAKGMRVSITDFGGIITEIVAPDKRGALADITLGYDGLEPYFENPVYFGAIVGRYANRIGNAEFQLNGKTYKVLKNDGKNHLHGGKEGFHKKLWASRVISEGGLEKLELTYRSADMEEGYPGNLDVRVLYSLDDAGALTIEYFAETDKDTVVNLTNHAYFNLAGQASGAVGGHMMQVNADSFTVVDDGCIPTGEIRPVEGTPLDLRKPANVGKGLAQEDAFEQMRFGHGYDHNFVINGAVKGKMVKAAEAFEPQSGRRMEVYTDLPGIQFYSGNFLGAVTGKGGVHYERRGGFCLETQFFPDAVNKPNFQSPVLKAGEKYHTTTKYVFTTDKD